MSVGRLKSILAIGVTAIAFSHTPGSAAALPKFTDGNALRIVVTAQEPQPAGASAQVEKRNHGIELYRQGKFVEASKVLQRAVKEYKTDHEAWYYLGLALLPQPGKAKDAAKAFEAVTKLQPRFAAAHTGLAYAALQRRKSSEAVLESRAALSIDPTLAEPHYIIGVVHVRAGDPAEALAEASEASRLNPDFAPPYLLKSQALVGMYAKKNLDTGRITPARPQPPTPQERAERHQSRQSSAALFKEAAASLQTYLKLDPNAPSAELLREQLENLEFYGSYSRDATPGSDRPAFGDEVTTKARVLAKPEPSYTEAARQAQMAGTVVLRAVLAADGTVRHILVISGLPNGLTEAAVRSARMIRFTPATIDGRPVSTFIQLEYYFNLY